MADAWSLLRERCRTAPGAPFITFVDVGEGQRTELSAASLENAVAKVANALQDEFDLSEGAVVGVHLPVHWQRSAWCGGIWTAGCLLAPGAVEADLLVAGPEQARALAGTGADIAVVSLHPLGMPVTESLPGRAADVTAAVRRQPDAYLGPPPSSRMPALSVDGSTVDQAEVLSRAAHLGRCWGLEAGGRLLADDRLDAPDGLDGIEAWLAALAVPLACSASVVLVAGDGTGIADQERVTAEPPRP